MDLPLDILKMILMSLGVNSTKNICFMNKEIYSQYKEKKFWIDKFNYDNLEIINFNMKNLCEYFWEYSRVLCATHISNCLINMITNNFTFSLSNIISHPVCNVDDFYKITQNQVFRDIISNKSKYVYISFCIKIGNKSYIKYFKHDTWSSYDIGTLIFEEELDIKLITTFLSKIFYHIPYVLLRDDKYIQINYNPDVYNYFYRTEDNVSNDKTIINTINERRNYWDECCIKFKLLYS
jgi:hypothetical protein